MNGRACMLTNVATLSKKNGRHANGSHRIPFHRISSKSCPETVGWGKKRRMRWYFDSVANVSLAYTRVVHAVVPAVAGIPAIQRDPLVQVHLINPSHLAFGVELSPPAGSTCWPRRRRGASGSTHY